jgi:hypothetical protein
MKKLIILSLSILSLSSCEKCYQCAVVITSTSTPNLPSFNSYASSVTDFCGTNKEKEAFVRAGNITTTSKSGNYTIVQKTITSCSLKK